MRLKKFICLALAAGLIDVAFTLQSAGQTEKREQTLFGTEGNVEKKHGNYIDHPPVERPVPLPEEIVKLLRADDRVSKCVKSTNVNEAPTFWFSASEIHLHDKDQVDYVVLPADGCLFGANTDPYWVFGKTVRGYDLILRADELGIEILKSKTNGYSDIRGISSTAVEVYTVKFKFDGQKYQRGQISVRPVGK
jgi:hypothetical protein